MNLFQMMQNPQQFAKQMLNQNVNPIQKNALEMLLRGDTDGMEKMARNICKERGIDVNEALNKLKGMR